jgi:hypothetical protein
MIGPCSPIIHIGPQNEYLGWLDILLYLNTGIGDPEKSGRDCEIHQQELCHIYHYNKMIDIIR